MPVFMLGEELWFPEPERAGKNGLLAIGGDLSPERLLLAYRKGIFPWYDEETPILWWSPDPRMVLFPGEFNCPKSLRLLINKNIHKVRFDVNFREVINRCATVPRKGQEGTWIIPEMLEAYCTLHEMGYAHSVEVYREAKLVGGLYGLSLGRAFFGESMFSLERDASKIALSALHDLIVEWDFQLIDTQQKTEHLRRLGARTVPRQEFLHLLKNALSFPDKPGKW